MGKEVDVQGQQTMSDNASDNQQTTQQTMHQDIAMKPDLREKILLSLADERVFVP